MSYNKNNVWIVDDDGFEDIRTTGFLEGYIRPTYTMLAEGDSWFHFGGFTGFGKPRNILEKLSFGRHHTVICNMAMLGDTIHNMSNLDRINSKYFYSLLKKHRWNGLLLSAGGNDLIDALSKEGGFKYGRKTLAIIRENTAGTSVEDFIDMEHLDHFKKALLESYRTLFAKVADTDNANIPIFIHTYDYPTARNSPANLKLGKVGPWIYTVCKDKNVPDAYWQDIVKFVFNELAITLTSLDSESNVTVIETHNTLVRAEPNTKKSSNDWLNEIHPNAEGIAKFAGVMNQTLDQVYRTPTFLN